MNVCVCERMRIIEDKQLEEKSKKRGWDQKTHFQQILRSKHNVLVYMSQTL